jgi:hypothetical protein
MNRVSKEVWENIDSIDRAWVAKVLEGKALDVREVVEAMRAILDYENCGYWNEGSELRGILKGSIGEEEFERMIREWWKYE